MSHLLNSNRLLFSTTNKQPALLKVFGMNLNDIRYHHDCLVCDNSRNQRQPEKKSSYNFDNRCMQATANENRVLRAIQINAGSERKPGAIKRYSFFSDVQKKIVKSKSVAGLMKTKQALPSSRVEVSGKAGLENLPTSCKSKHPQEFAKIRNNNKINKHIAVFDSPVSKSSKYSNHCVQKPLKFNISTIKPSKTYRNSFQKSNSSKSELYNNTKQICKTEYDINAVEEQADSNLLNFLNMKLFGPKPV